MLCGHVFIYISMQKAFFRVFAYVVIKNSLNKTAAAFESCAVKGGNRDIKLKLQFILYSWCLL